VPPRCDWNLIRGVCAVGLAWPTLEMAGLIDTEPSGSATVVASDHYEVVSSLQFPSQVRKVEEAR
jgi:hypothetical protein